MAAEIQFDITEGDNIASVTKLASCAMFCTDANCGGCKDICACYDGPKERARLNIIVTALNSDVVTMKTFNGCRLEQSSGRPTDLLDDNITINTFNFTVDITKSVIVFKMIINDVEHTLMLSGCTTFV
jgi:hypothetical protein